MASNKVGVNIVAVERLDRLAREIDARHDYAAISRQGRPGIGLQYYLDATSWQGRLSPIEIAYFDHADADGAITQRNFEIAAAVDHCVCASEAFERLLRDRGIKHVSTIVPGIDLAHFRPMVKIGVVGPASGDEGEALVGAVMTVDGVEFHFTGPGWPKLARLIAPQDMPAFYNAMDYILIPSVQGSQETAVEALACGTPLIAPPASWISAFPHYEFRAGDAADLRRVLQEILDERSEHRALLTERGWSHWADAHDKLFRELLKKHGQAPGPATAAAAPAGPALLATRGTNADADAMAAAMRTLGADVRTAHFPSHALGKTSLIHGFDVQDPQTALALARYAASLERPFVFSPLYMDRSESDLWSRKLPDALRRVRDAAEFDAQLFHAISSFAREKAGGGSGRGTPGYDAVTRTLVNQADHVVCVSDWERKALTRIGARPRALSVVRAAVDPAPFAQASGKAFETFAKVRDYVLCVGPIEPRNNQLLLLHALRDINIPIVLLGPATDASYGLLVDSLKSANVVMPGARGAQGALLASAYAGARLVVQPSWAESVPQAALEAAASGTPMILSDRSAAREYLGEQARYCDPASPAALRDIILNAYDTPPSADDSAALVALVQDRYARPTQARALLDVYRQTWTGFTPAAAPAPQKSEATPPIALDISALVYRAGDSAMLAGERALAETLIAQTGGAVRFIAWNRSNRRFVELDHTALYQGELVTYVDFANKTGLFPTEFAPGTRYVVAGGLWMENIRYTEDVITFVNASGIDLALLVYDISPLGRTRGPLLAPADVLAHTLDLMLASATSVLASSSTTAADLAWFAASRGLPAPYTATVRPGDGFFAAPPASALPADIADALPAEFALTVAQGGVGADENILIRIWDAMATEMGDACPALVLARPARQDDLAATPLAGHGDNPRVTTIDNATDAVLAALFARAALVVVPPGNPGGWLPAITESLRQGRLCLAPKSAATQDAGGDAVEQIDPLDLPLWQARLAYYMGHPAARQQRAAQARFTPTSWAMTAKALCDALASGPGHAPGSYVLGTALRLTDRPGDVRKHAGWYRSEDWGCWSSARQASLIFSLDAPHDGDLILIAELRSPLTPKQDNLCDVLVNGVSAGRLVLRGPSWGLYSLPIPAALVAGQREIMIELRGTRHNELPATSATPGIKEPVRRAGLGVANIALADARFPLGVADYASQPGSLAAAAMIGEEIDLTRDPRSRTIFPEEAAFGTGWGARHVSQRPQLLLKVLDRGFEDLTVRLRYRAVASSEAPLRMPVATRDGVVRGMVEADDDSIREVTLTLPASLRVQPIQLEFLGAQKRSPLAMGLGFRKEGFDIGFYDVRIERAGKTSPPRVPQYYALGQTISFRQFDVQAGAVPASHFQEPLTWHLVEASGCWTHGAVGQLSLQLAQAPRAPLFARMEVTGWSIPGSCPAMEVRINGAIVARIAELPASRILKFEIPPERFGGDGVMQIEFVANKVLHPTLAGVGSDDRRLGVLLQTLTISDDPALMVREEAPGLSPAPVVGDSWSDVAHDADDVSPAQLFQRSAPSSLAAQDMDISELPAIATEDATPQEAAEDAADALAAEDLVAAAIAEAADEVEEPTAAIPEAPMAAAKNDEEADA